MPVNLLETKLHQPVLLPRWVRRPHLVKRLNAGLAGGRRLTLVSAPAGFGKTCCISEWLSGLNLPVAWLSLDSADDEPGRFFTYLFAALQKVDRSLCRELESLLRAGQLPPAEVIGTVLVNDLQASPNHFLLVLDDLHVIQERFILQILEKLLAHLPPALHLVLLTREDPPLPLARLRANDQMTEIRAAELRFTPAEAAFFLNESMGLNLSPADVAALEERTEGWIVGLQLAGLSVRDRSDPSHFIATLSGSHRYILNYLSEEVLSRQSAEVQQFLMQTSILERLSGDLCDAITENSGSHALLEQLCGANLFLVPLDDELHWYRYHHLFAGLLRERLTILHKDKTAVLHQHASHWYAQASAASLRIDEQAAFATQAIQHALAAADYQTAVGLIEDHAMSMIVQWYTKTVNGWVQALPAQWRMKSPKVNLAFAWNYLFHGDFAQAAPYLEQLAGIFSNSQMEELAAVRAEWLALQAWLQNAQGNPTEGLVLANQALESVSAADRYTRSLIYMALAGAYNQMDDYVHAVEAYQQLIAYGKAADNLIFELLGTAALGQILIFHGQYRYTFEIASQVMGRLERSAALHPISTAVYGELAEIHYQWNQLEQAREDIQRAVQVSSLSGYSHASVYYKVFLSRMFQREGQLAAAEREIQEIQQILQAARPGPLNEEVVSQQVRLALAQDRLTEAEAAFSPLWAARTGANFSSQTWVSLPAFSPDRAITYPVGRMINIALRLLLHRARRDRDPLSLQRGIQLAGDLLEQCLKSGYLPIAMETLLLRAQFQSAAGNLESSLADVIAALEIGEPQGVISIFVEEGQPVAQALALALARRSLAPVLKGYIGKLLEAFPQVRTPLEPQDEPERLIEPLTEREIEVLRLIAEGLKYEEIGQKLFISLNTVRTYVKGIYGKLEVNNRAKAVLLAHQYKII